jgi:hypothetical protein
VEAISRNVGNYILVYAACILLKTDLKLHCLERASFSWSEVRKGLHNSATGSNVREMRDVVFIGRQLSTAFLLLSWCDVTIGASDRTFAVSSGLRGCRFNCVVHLYMPVRYILWVDNGFVLLSTYVLIWAPLFF